MGDRSTRFSLVTLSIAILSGCSTTPIPADVEVSVLSVTPSEWGPKTRGLGDSLLGTGALAGSLLVAIAKSIVIDEVVDRAREAVQDTPQSIYDADYCWVQVQMPEDYPRSFMASCKYLIKTNRHTSGAKVWLRYDRNGDPFVVQHP